MNHEDYCTFEQCVKLKELGFDWECNHYYQDTDQSLHPNFYEDFNKHNKMEYTKDNVLIKVNLCSAPTLSQAAKWLRGKGIGITVQIYTKEKRDWGPNYFEGVFYRPYFTSTKDAHTMGIINNDFNSYEEAFSAGVDGALKKLNDIG